MSVLHRNTAAGAQSLLRVLLSGCGNSGVLGTPAVRLGTEACGTASAYTVSCVSSPRGVNSTHNAVTCWRATRALSRRTKCAQLSANQIPRPVSPPPPDESPKTRVQPVRPPRARAPAHLVKNRACQNFDATRQPKSSLRSSGTAPQLGGQPAQLLNCCTLGMQRPLVYTNKLQRLLAPQHLRKPYQLRCALSMVPYR